MSHNPAPQKHISGATRYGFHPAQYRKAQANDVYRQYQKQVFSFSVLENSTVRITFTYPLSREALYIMKAKLLPYILNL